MKVIRWPYLLAAAICLFLVWQASRSSATPAEVVGPNTSRPRPASPAPTASLPTELPSLAVQHIKPANHASGLFAIKDWMPPPPVAAPAPVVRTPVIETPVAPQLPFRYFGRLSLGDDKNVVFLVNGEVLHSVKVGDVIDERYKIKKIEGNVMTLLYLPLNQTQTLSWGSAQ